MVAGDFRFRIFDADGTFDLVASTGLEAAAIENPKSKI
jgi:hypothetical protein